VPLETRVLRFEREHEAPEAIRALLKDGQPAGLAFLALLRLVDDRVIAYDRCYFPSDLAERFDPRRPLAQPVLETIWALAGAPPTSVDWEIEIEPGAKDAVAALGVTPGLPVVVATSTLRRDDGWLVVRAERFYRIDRVRFRQSGRYPPAPVEPEFPAPAVIR
jgi:DNA-binding GntR family transcriptional regulator